MKHDIAKFRGVYKSVLNSKESGMSLGDVLERALDLYKVRHPKQQPFVFLHCWRILSDVSQWCDSIVAGNLSPYRSPFLMPKQKVMTPPHQRSSQFSVQVSAEEEREVKVLTSCRVPKPPVLSQCQKATKEADRVLPHKEIIVQVQMRAIAELTMVSI